MKVQKTKVYQLFAALSLQERKDFVRYLRRRSKAKRAKIKAGLRYLCKSALDIEHGVATNEDWWKQTFPELPFSAQALRKHQNALISELEQFLVDRKWHREPDAYLAQVRNIEHHLLLLAALLERALDHLFQHYAKKTEDMIALLSSDHEKFALQFRLEILKIDFQRKNNPFKTRPEFTLAQVALDRYYVLYSLKLEVATRNHQKINHGQQDLGRLNAVMNLLSSLPSQDPLTALCLQLLALSETTGYEACDALQAHLIAAADTIAPDAWKDLLYVSLNFSIRRINEGQEVFQLTALQAYRALLGTGHLQKDIASFKYNFLNILRLEFNRGEHSSLSKYIQEQKTILEQDEEYKNAGLFYQCEEAFSKGDTQKACDCFWKVWMLEGGKKVRHAAGVFILKSYYDLAEWDQLKQFASDFKKIIKADKALSEAKKEAYKEFLKSIQILSKIKFNGLSPENGPRLEQLEKKVTTSPLMIARGWLLSKIVPLWKNEK